MEAIAVRWVRGRGRLRVKPRVTLGQALNHLMRRAPHRMVRFLRVLKGEQRLAALNLLELRFYERTDLQALARMGPEVYASMHRIVQADVAADRLPPTVRVRRDLIACAAPFAPTYNPAGDEDRGEGCVVAAAVRCVLEAGLDGKLDILLVDPEREVADAERIEVEVHAVVLGWPRDLAPPGTSDSAIIEAGLRHLVATRQT